MSAHKLPSPFSSATVVVAEEYVNTFPNHRGLFAYLRKLCMQLNVVILSSERPMTVKGSWKAIIQIDAFLRTLVSTHHNSLASEGDVPELENEETFNSNFIEHLEVEDENSNQKESLINTNTAHSILEENDLSELKTDDFYKGVKTDEDNSVPVVTKWYFNSISRRKTVGKISTSSKSGKMLPEPYVLIETGERTREKKTNLFEIEQALSQVYKQETFERFQQKTFCDDKQSQEIAVLVGSAKDLAALDFNTHQQTKIEPKHQKEQSDEERNLNILTENCNLHLLQHVQNVKLEIESRKSEPKFSVCKIKKVCSLDSEASGKDSKLPKSRRTTRQTNSENKKTTGLINKNGIVRKKQKQHRRHEKERTNSETNIAEISHLTNHKVSRPTKEIVKQSGRKSPRQHNKTSTEDIPHEASQKVKKNRTKLKKGLKDGAGPQEHSSTKTKVKTKKIAEKCKNIETSSKETLNQHKRETVYAKFSCDQCPYLTTKQLQLTEHKTRIHLTKQFKCDKCFKEFGFQKDLQRHMKCHRKADNCCDKCGKMYKYAKQLIEHKRIHADDYVKPEFPCKFCSKKFSTKYVLAHHIKSDHLGMRRFYVCPTCGKSFSQKNSYIQHANVHLGIKLFSCEICEEKFSYLKSLKEHRFTHKEEKVFECTFCQKSFRQASGLAIHMRVHKPTREYVCSMCGKGFTQKQALVRHERTHGGDKPYECGLCNRTFADSSVLRRHMILIHKRDPKGWREGTVCHIRGRSDYFIDVLNEDGLHAQSSETNTPGDICSKKLEEEQENIFNSSLQKQQNQLDQSQPVPHLVEHLVPDHIDDIIPENTSPSVAGFKEPFSPEALCTDVKPYIGCALEKVVTTDSLTDATQDRHKDTRLFSSSALDNQHSPESNPTHLGRTVATHPHHSTIALLHPSQSQPQTPASLIPFTCHQGPATCYAGNIQPAPYSRMTTQPHPDNFNATTYCQSEISTDISQ